jgi:hypothetical protein
LNTLFALLVALSSTVTADSVITTLPVGMAWAGHPVGFCLLTEPPHQYVGFYDGEQRLTLAQRLLDSRTWTLMVLDEHVGWDSHNSITFVIDSDGHIHLAANMHVHPLKYWRTTKPHDISTLTREPAMIGSEEKRVTYPQFFRGPDDALIFTYRDGSSGSGNQIYNIYDAGTRAWRRLLDKPLIDGGGAMNAYPRGPVAGPDGFWHLVWVWRDTSDCATNHDLSYARSRDLTKWERSDGAPFDLPITLETAEVVDPVPPGGGMINGNTAIGFDGDGRLVLSYHKHDENGHTQIYNARREDGAWRIVPVSDWDYRWEFQGGGSIHFELHVQGVRMEGGQLVQGFGHDRFGSGRWVLDPETLRPVDTLPPAPSPYPAQGRVLQSDFPGMGVRWRGDSGTSGEGGVHYFLRWETLGPNRDKPRERPWPSPSPLVLYRVESE